MCVLTLQFITIKCQNGIKVSTFFDIYFAVHGKVLCTPRYLRDAHLLIFSFLRTPNIGQYYS